MTQDEKYKIWDSIVEELRGTAGFCIPEEFENDKDFLDYLDSQIFICQSCGWWCERGEESYTQYEHCENCVDDTY